MIISHDSWHNEENAAVLWLLGVVESFLVGGECDLLWPELCFPGITVTLQLFTIYNLSFRVTIQTPRLGQKFQNWQSRNSH